jgi:hypothetical protein
LLWPDLLRSNGGTVTLAPLVQSASWLKKAAAICERPALCTQAKITFCIVSPDFNRVEVEAVSAGTEPGLRVHPEEGRLMP